MTDTSQPDSIEPVDEEAEELDIPMPDKTAAPKSPDSHVAGLNEQP